jgi:glycosyltransferase involved in cell wall biosynthesis
MTKLLVLTTVHQADDTRIRERTIASLSQDFEVDYASKPPAPSRLDGIRWRGLEGGRVWRWFRAVWLMLSGRYEVVSIHDPELIPAALLARLIRRRKIVFDVHEHVPAQVRHKDWIPRLLRRPLAWLVHRFLRLAERHLTLTLAEDGYHVLFRGRHPVFPNYPRRGALPDPTDHDGYLVYVGDVTEYRGASLMVEAVGRMAEPRPLTIVGRITDEMVAHLRTLADRFGVDMTLAGPRPNAEAMSIAAAGIAGLALMADVPNNRWSQPTKLFEYLGVGIPLIATRLPGIEQAVGEMEAVTLVPPDDAATVARALDVLVADPSAREAARRQAPGLRGMLVWPDDLVRRVYQELLEGKRR